MPFHRVDDPGNLKRLIDAVLMVATDVDLGSLLGHLVEEAAVLAGARYGALGILTPQGDRLEQFVTVGLDATQRAAIGDRPTGRGLLGLLIRRPQSTHVAVISGHPDRVGFPRNHPPMTTFLGVPVFVRGTHYANIYLTDKAGGADFTDDDEALVSTLAQAAAVGIENARLMSKLHDATLVEDRDRIARDLHDTIIQRLFAVGLSLQGAAHLAERPEVTARIASAVADLDETIRDLRTAIFDLEHVASDRGPRELLLSVADELTPTLGFRPHITFSGPLDALATPEITENLVAVTREALTNAARHAHAQRVRVLVAAGTTICLEVTDDGIGADSSARATAGRPDRADGTGHGRANLAARAKSLGGTVRWETPEGGGTRVVWEVPVAAEPA